MVIPFNTKYLYVLVKLLGWKTGINQVDIIEMRAANAQVLDPP